MKPHHFQTLVVGALCLSAAVLAGETYNHHQELVDLQAAARNVPADPVPALRADINALGDQLKALQPQMLSLADTQRQQTTEQIALGKQQDELAASLKALETTPQGPSSADLAALEQRVTEAEAALDRLSSHHTVPTAITTPPSASTDQVAKSKAPAPPFTLLGVETRGSVRFLAVQPPGPHSLSTVHLLQLGDRLNGWQLQEIRRNDVVFQVDGHGSRTLPLP